jgi:hypothetical protein
MTGGDQSRFFHGEHENAVLPVRRWTIRVEAGDDLRVCFPQTPRQLALAAVEVGDCMPAFSIRVVCLAVSIYKSSPLPAESGMYNLSLSSHGPAFICPMTYLPCTCRYIDVPEGAVVPART